ncbi:MAG: hypothetical protein ACOX5J_09580 [Candidatus Hydrogenedentales bacterium]|jgi:hypothetical protein
MLAYRLDKNNHNASDLRVFYAVFLPYAFMGSMVASFEAGSVKFDEGKEKYEIKRRKVRLEALATKNEDSARLEKGQGFATA